MNRRTFLFGLAAVAATAPLSLVSRTAQAAPSSAQSVVPDPAYENLRVIVESSTKPSRVDPIGTYGFLSYKARCLSCQQSYGEWQKFSAQVEELGLFVLPTEAMARATAVSYLHSAHGWTFSRQGGTCGPCNGRASSLRPLSEGIVPTPTDWYSPSLVVAS